MFHDKGVWGLACELARSGDYANIIMIERELRQRGLLAGELTTNIVKRELLTRTCHAAREGFSLDIFTAPVSYEGAGEPA